ncbi:MAG: hypothetical protein QOF06_2468 [Solirubrobacterales bacterium]|nr:hypothetical protein [Solirubrobacterales bacterium]
MATTSQAGLPEQITDQAIASAEEDLLGHEDFVNRILRIVQNSTTPANIALFGRWGSGKSGIGNRLREEVRERPEFTSFRFVYFDAFKLARLPLLRRFLLHSAEELGGHELATTYQQRIYEQVERVKPSHTLAQLKKPLIVWTTRLLWALAAAIFAFDAIAYLLSGDQLTVFLAIAKNLLPILLPAGLLAAVAAFAAQYLRTSTTTETPSSEEQFEALFDELLDEQGIGPDAEDERLVVFVDELDRCSAVEVARTLESLKTFLDHPGCIFIVAADQRVLEHALTQRVRQATPRDLSNPYYSAGSAYLDKIFQYQLNLPPLYPGRLTDFALKLLEEVGGIWDEVESKDDVVSVLLPIHVRSPRRVKVLLNSFAQTFAVALARAKSKNLDRQVKQRAEEVAKLVGLQVEFPLFAADLPLHRDLPDLVLECAESGEPESLPSLQGVPKATRERVMQFAAGKLPTDISLTDGDQNALISSQGTDLIDYLRQTDRVKGPRQDLVHLEGPSQSSGIDQALVFEIDDLALRNQPILLKEALEALPEDTERRGAVNRLRELVRESKGNDESNAIRALLLCWRLGKRPGGIPKDLVGAVERHEREGNLVGDEMPSALEIAVEGGDRTLQRLIVDRAEATEEPLRSRALDFANSLIRENPDRLGELLAGEIVESPEKAVKRIAS